MRIAPKNVKLAKGICGFFFNIVIMILEILPMSYDAARICYRDDLFPWEMDDLEMAEKLEEIDNEDDD